MYTQNKHKRNKTKTNKVNDTKAVENIKYRTSFNKRRATSKRSPLIKAALLRVHIEISASL